ncbi:MAG TPA: HAD family acid phosphatase [Allosphingosinicella sp.]|uniref:5'-nucleotidase, lipoprotein e(P4) family n=1 Tax=Allosphingosinicella sp. TaxID=2823234 RepID=UPI002EDA4490
MMRKSAAAVLLALSACTTAPAPVTVLPAPAASAEPPKTMQWLYGSGEAGATSIQAYHAMRDYVRQFALRRPAQSVILAEGSTLDSPRFQQCGNKPLAVVLDVDETALLNLGYEYDEAVKGRSYSQEIWDRWERTGADNVAPVPGAVTALRAIREAGVKVIFNTNRKAENATFTEIAINQSGLGPARHRDTLFLQGDAGSGSAKDARRALIAERYCVIAMAGDQLGDFSDLFNVKTLSVPDRRRAATSGSFASLWGNGWFMLPNPVYGPSVRGSYDDVFPADKRWVDPGTGGAD